MSRRVRGTVVSEGLARGEALVVDGARVGQHAWRLKMKNHLDVASVCALERAGAA